MKILAMEKESPQARPEEFQMHRMAEAARVWELVQSGVVRETYFRQDRPEAVLMLECENAEEAGRTLMSLPLVKAGLIYFEIIPLIPYPGYSRLFGNTAARPPAEP